MNYQTRERVDGQLVDSLSRKQHIVIHGSSKQGKTSLRKYNLQPDDYVLVTCSSRLTLAQLHLQILKDAGYTIEGAVTKVAAGIQRATVKASLRARIFGVAEAGGEVGAGMEASHSTSRAEHRLELDPEDVNDIIRALNEIKVSPYILLEDFHYLPEETQKDFAVSLKSIHENSDFTFIIVGVWLDENRLVQHNGDLDSRVVSINADLWSDEELLAVIGAGENLLNVRFPDDFKRELVSSSVNAVYIVQEACRRALEDTGVFSRSDTQREVVPTIPVRDLLQEVVNTSSARYEGFISTFAEGFQSTELEMQRWLMGVVAMTEREKLERGLTYNEITQALRRYHPRGADLNAGNVSQVLKSAAPLQVQKNIKPIVLDYDQTRKRLNIVDRGFLIWKSFQDPRDLLDVAGLPDLTSV